MGLVRGFPRVRGFPGGDSTGWASVNRLHVVRFVGIAAHPTTLRPTWVGCSSRDAVPRWKGHLRTDCPAAGVILPLRWFRFGATPGTSTLAARLEVLLGFSRH